MFFKFRKNKKDLEKKRFSESILKIREERFKAINEVNKKKLIKKSKQINFKRILVLGLIVFLITSFFFLFDFLRSSSSFNIENIILSKEYALNLEGVLNKNLFKISNFEIKNEIYKTNPYIENLFIRKILPNSLYIDFDYLEPNSIFITFKGSSLIDSNGKVLKTISEEVLNLSEEKKAFLQSEKNLDSSFLIKNYISKLSIEEKEDFSWSNLSPEDKDKFYEELLSSIKNSEKAFFENQINLSRNLNLNIPIIIFKNYLEKDLELINFAVKVEELLKDFKIDFIEIYWVSNLTLEVLLDENSKILFSSIEPFDEQKLRLSSIISNSKFIKPAIFDIRSKNFTIKSL